MPINVRTKGAKAERDVADDLNVDINVVKLNMGVPISGTPEVQRNQNQSAVGGKDLVGTYGLAIEVKRQETLNINTWWKQCVASAAALGEIPVLIFRQNQQKWRVIMPAHLGLPVSNGAVYSSMEIRAELEYETFRLYFKERVGRALYAKAEAEGAK